VIANSCWSHHFFSSFFKGRVYTSLVSLSKVYYFSRKSLSKYLMDTIDFNKHDINIFINLVKIVRYGRHCRDESCNEWWLPFWWQLSQCEIAPIWRLQKYVHFKYILWHFEYMSYNYKIIIIVDWILCPGKSKITQSKQKFYNPSIGL
jgi:hypothetical protein